VASLCNNIPVEKRPQGRRNKNYGGKTIDAMSNIKLFEEKQVRSHWDATE